MPLRIVINISKKIPGAQDFSSASASCSIESDLAHGQDPTAEAASLYRQAELAVDRQLGIAPATSVAAPRPAPTTPNAPIGSSSARAPATGRRGPAPISAAQLRYLGQLLERNPGVRERILADHRISTIEALSSRDASAVIDQLKGAA